MLSWPEHVKGLCFIRTKRVPDALMCSIAHLRPTCHGQGLANTWKRGRATTSERVCGSETAAAKGDLVERKCIAVTVALHLVYSARRTAQEVLGLPKRKHPIPTAKDGTQR